MKRSISTRTTFSCIAVGALTLGGVGVFVAVRLWLSSTEISRDEMPPARNIRLEAQQVAKSAPQVSLSALAGRQVQAHATVAPDVVRIFLATLRAQLETVQPEARAALVAKLVAEPETGILQALLEDEGHIVALTEDLLHAMLRRLARDEAAWTGDFLTALPADGFRRELLGTVSTEWGRRDLPAAVAWAQTIPDADLRRTALIHLSYQWFGADPAGALGFAVDHAKENPQLLATLVGQWSREQPERAATWAVRFADSDAAGRLTASAVAAWAARDELAAAEFVLGLPAGPLREQSAIALLSALSRHPDPTLGTHFIPLFPVGSARDYAVENLAYGWAASDSRSAADWASQLPAHERDVALHAGAGALIRSNLPLAASWSMSIQDEAMRHRQTERIARAWLERDAPTARSWIASSALPEAQKQSLLAGIAPRN